MKKLAYFIFLIVFNSSLVVPEILLGQFSAETATMVKIQTAKQSGWHATTKKIQQAGNKLNRENLKVAKRNLDRLRKVKSIIRQAQRVKAIFNQQVAITKITFEALRRIRNDPNFSIDEKIAIKYGYEVLLKESTLLLSELKLILKPKALEMDDYQRLKMIQEIGLKMDNQAALVSYYTKSNMATSGMRKREAREIAASKKLFGIKK